MQWLLFFFLSCALGLSASEISIEFPDAEVEKVSDGRELPTVAVGDTFTVKITFHGEREQPGEDDLDCGDIERSFKCLGGAAFGGQVQMMSFINGKQDINRTERSWNLSLQAVKEGIQKIGPMTVTLPSGQLKSGIFYCNVVAAEQQQQRQPQRRVRHQQRGQSEAEVVTELVVPKKPIFVGESFEVIIRCFLSGSIQQIMLGGSAECGLYVKRSTENRGLKEVYKNGAMHRVYEFVCPCVAVKPGTAQVGPFEVIYLSMESFFHGFFSLSQNAQKSITSQSAPLTIKALPKEARGSLVVGKISEFDVVIEKQTAQVNEPLKLKLSITGVGGLELVDDFPFKLPAHFRIYKTKSSLETSKTQGTATKHLEYVLQVNKSGHVEFPALRFGFFNPETEIQDFISSKPIELFLTGDVVTPPTKTVDQLAQEAFAKDGKSGEKDHIVQIFASEKGGGPTAIPWWLFLLLIFVMPFWHYHAIKQWFIERVLKRLKGAPSKRDIIARAEAELKKIHGTGKAETLHPFFVSTLSMLWSVHEQSVTDLFIENYLIEKGWSEEHVRGFLEFFHLCAELYFTRKSRDVAMNEGLLKKAHYWLLLLDK